ncbi:MAG TPA: phage/plasmid primase, P4 family [Candidatus Baltobacteraceae bacterium]|nr:phage/plasmid primase, P4 family [Candidatus Baltobacteraceae bacterium]
MINPKPLDRKAQSNNGISDAGNRNGTIVDLSTLLFDVLAYKPDEFVSVCHKVGGDGVFLAEVCEPTELVARVDALPDKADIYFGVSPVAGPPRVGEKGRAEDVTRLPALWADLDVKSGSCASLDVAQAIVDELSEVLGTRPSAVTNSGGGLHPYWPISDGDAGGDVDLAVLLRRWGRLVKAVAKKHGAKADSVFNLDRILRAPGTYNCKAATNGHGGVPVVCYADSGRALTLAELSARLDEHGVHEAEVDSEGGEQLSDPDNWEFADETCAYAQKWIDGLAEDGPPEGGGRHQWVGSEAVRFACARRNGCINGADYQRAAELVEDRLRRLRAQTSETVPPYEVPSWWIAGAEIAAAKTDVEVRAELGNHRHLWPPPDAPRDVAKRVVGGAKRAGRPQRYWNGLWFVWCGTHYRRMAVEDFRDELYELLADATYRGATDELRWKPNPAKLNGVIDAARGLVRLPDGIGATGWIDGHKELVIPCANGLLRVEDRTLLDHTPEHFNIMSLPYNFDAGAVCPRWMRFLDEVFGDDAETVALLQQWFGYVLSGRTELQKMLMWLGPKRGGKGTVAHLMKRLVGPDAYAGMTVEALRRNFALQNLLDKSLVVFPDERQVGAPDGKRLVQFVLQATGEDDVQVERKYKTAWNGRLPMRLMYMGNEMPVLPDSSGAVQNRILMIETVVSFAGREERGLEGALVAELPGILNWALDGLDALQEHGELKQPESGRNLLQDIDESSNHVRRFLQSGCCQLGDGKRTRSDVLWAVFEGWCSRNGVEGKLNSVWLGRQLRPAMRDLAPGVKFERQRDQSEEGRPYYYMGIGLPDNETGRRWW